MAWLGYYFLTLYNLDSLNHSFGSFLPPCTQEEIFQLEILRVLGSNPSHPHRKRALNPLLLGLFLRKTFFKFKIHPAESWSGFTPMAYSADFFQKKSQLCPSRRFRYIWMNCFLVLKWRQRNNWQIWSIWTIRFYEIQKGFISHNLSKKLFTIKHLLIQCKRCKATIDL